MIDVTGDATKGVDGSDAADRPQADDDQHPDLDERATARLVPGATRDGVAPDAAPWSGKLPRRPVWAQPLADGEDEDVVDLRTSLDTTATDPAPPARPSALRKAMRGGPAGVRTGGK